MSKIRKVTIEENRTWDEIPSDGKECTNVTETCYHQKWPFNSYIDDRKEAVQALASQAVPLVGPTVESVLNEDYVGAVANFFTAGVYGAVNAIANLFSKKKERKKSDVEIESESNGNRPAGCLAIALLQLLYHYRDVSSVKNKFPELEKMYLRYEFLKDKEFTQSDGSKKKITGLFRTNNVTINYDWKETDLATADDVKNVNKVMERICKAIPVSVFTEMGTAVLPTHVDDALSNIGFKRFRDEVHGDDTNSSYERVAEILYQSLCNGVIPLAFVRGKNREWHYYLIDGCKFDKVDFKISKSYAKTCTFSQNLGWGSGSEKFISIKKLGYFKGNSDDGGLNHISKLWFFAPSKKVVTYEVLEKGKATKTEVQLAINRRTAFDNLIGEDYKLLENTILKFRKGEVVKIEKGVINTKISGSVDSKYNLYNGLATIISGPVVEDGITFYYISLATQYLKDLVDSTSNILAKLAVGLYETIPVPVENIQKIVARELTSLFIWERNGINAPGLFYARKLAVGEKIFNDPTLITQNWLIRPSDAYISKVYDDGTCDVYFPYNKKTYHSYVPFNGISFVEHYNYPATTSIPAPFKTGDEVWYGTEEKSFKTTIREGGVFLLNNKRTYWIKNQGGSGLQYGEESKIYKVVYTINPNNFY